MNQNLTLPWSACTPLWKPLFDCTLENNVCEKSLCRKARFPKPKEPDMIVP